MKPGAWSLEVWREVCEVAVGLGLGTGCLEVRMHVCLALLGLDSLGYRPGAGCSARSDAQISPFGGRLLHNTIDSSELVRVRAWRAHHECLEHGMYYVHHELAMYVAYTAKRLTLHCGGLLGRKRS